MSEIISQDEFNKLMVVAVNTAPKKGLSEKQLLKFAEWAQYVRLGNQILDRILSGELEMFSLNKDGSPGIVRPTLLAADKSGLDTGPEVTPSK